jgi:hypothetical protein
LDLIQRKVEIMLGYGRIAKRLAHQRVGPDLSIAVTLIGVAHCFDDQLSRPSCQDIRGLHHKIRNAGTAGLTVFEQRTAEDLWQIEDRLLDRDPKCLPFPQPGLQLNKNSQGLALQITVRILLGRRPADITSEC